MISAPILSVCQDFLFEGYYFYNLSSLAFPFLLSQCRNFNQIDMYLNPDASSY